MPLYRYLCPVCAAARDIMKPLSEFDRTEHCHKCPSPMNRQICAPAVFGDFTAYSCPITGKRIEGRKAHEANLREHGCRVLEPGETRQAATAAQRADEAFEESVAETAAAFVANLPPAKQEQLAVELEHGASFDYGRTAV